MTVLAETARVSAPARHHRGVRARLGDARHRRRRPRSDARRDHQRCDHHIRHGWIGRQLAGHFTRHGLTAIEIHPATLVLQSLTVALDLLELAGAGTAEWRDDLGERDRDGVFFAAITGFTVKGRVAGAVSGSG